MSMFEWGAFGLAVIAWIWMAWLLGDHKDDANTRYLAPTIPRIQPPPIVQDHQPAIALMKGKKGHAKAARSSKTS